ncbi:unnamed protein product [Spirodela intermedia]|uniref:RING-type domain-containing protein n=1 Tax=Spirodela intermedia TaxID=51605 RepID=A0A7I8JSN2_SPIIN|nr:unnamed protein product [Spirodela intermedia]CAA6672593.1 unnamed protein product [Spirodela intermedia]
MEAGRRSGRTRWRDLRRRLCFQGGVGWCGSSWGFREPAVVDGDPGFGGEIPAASSPPDETINLATALAAERQFRAASAPTQPQRGRVDEESYQWEAAAASTGEEPRDGGGRLPRAAWCCCVCMRRRKAAALIPCGHTFCRVCSRELRLNRGACPSCNRRILDVLDIF